MKTNQSIENYIKDWLQKNETDQAYIQTEEFDKVFAYGNPKNYAHIHTQEIFADTDETKSCTHS